MIGILPAAGEARRMHGIPKYLLPVGNSFLMERHIHMMEDAGCNPIYIGCNNFNYGWLENYVDGRLYPASEHGTMSQTLLSSDLHLGDEPIIFGMPDTYFEDQRVYERLIHALEVFTDALVIVAVAKARPDQHRKVGMVRWDGIGEVKEIIDKPEETDLEYLWGALAWRSAFWRYIRAEDPHVGYAVQRAIGANEDVRMVGTKGGYWDCGTPDEYFALIRHLTGEQR